MAEWPIREVEACVNGKWGDADVVFQSLRKPLIKSEDTELLSYVVHASSVWLFLIRFPERRKNYKSQAVECLRKLAGSSEWRAAFFASPELVPLLDNLPDDVSKP
jgi:hypothetical protein